MKRFLRDKVDNVITIAELDRMTIEETLQTIKNRLGLEITKNALYKRRDALRKKDEEKWSIWRKDSYAYKRLHSQILDETDDSLSSINRQIRKLDNGNPKNFYWLNKSRCERLEWLKYREHLISKIPGIDSAVRSEDLEDGMEYQTNQEPGKAITSGRVFS